MSNDDTTDTGQSWPQRLRDARQAKRAAAAVYEQTIRDAKNVGGMTASGIAAAIDVKDRSQITKYLRVEAPANVPPVRLPLVVYLEGYARPAALQEATAAMYQRGWLVTGPLGAWHLSRAGARVVCVHFPRDSEFLTVSLVQAVHEQPATEDSYRVADLLPTSAGIALERAHPEAAELRVQVPTVAQEWKTITKRTHGRPERYFPELENAGGTLGAFAFDPEPLAGWVADIID
ncbi:hypothetical protein GTW37_32780 [Streptomyces sp. SID4931]|nr:hypothetical protein [Streptomyces sp. SID4931]SCG07155.1 hypothetical protein GA0115255_122276 [Streptomyces sp. Ncost-T6T-2b]